MYYVFHLSTTFVYSTTLPVHQPFEAVMEVSGVKTRYSEQTMLPAEADILLVIESSSEEDSETDDQSYFPPEVYAQTWQGYITHVMHVVLHCLVFTSYMDCHLLTCLLYKSYIWIISCHHVYIHNIYLNYGMATWGSPGLGGVRVAGLYLQPDSWTMKIQDWRLRPVSGWDFPWRGRQAWRCGYSRSPTIVTDSM